MDEQKGASPSQIHEEGSKFCFLFGGAKSQNGDSWSY